MCLYGKEEYSPTSNPSLSKRTSPIFLKIFQNTKFDMDFQKNDILVRCKMSIFSYMLVSQVVALLKSRLLQVTMIEYKCIYSLLCLSHSNRHCQYLKGPNNFDYLTQVVESLMNLNRSNSSTL
jgi:hypothetical protein